MNKEKTMTKNNHYNFLIKNIPYDVNDILQGIDDKMKRENIECSRIEFNYLSLVDNNKIFT